MSLYPRVMRFTAPGHDTVEIAVVISRTGWRFDGTLYRALFQDLRPAQRLSLRRQFAAQVELAKNTPTKGEHR